jgi:hypothetical protein
MRSATARALAETRSASRDGDSIETRFAMSVIDASSDAVAATRKGCTPKE